MKRILDERDEVIFQGLRCRDNASGRADRDNKYHEFLHVHEEEV